MVERLSQFRIGRQGLLAALFEFLLGRRCVPETCLLSFDFRVNRIAPLSEPPVRSGQRRIGILKPHHRQQCRGDRSQNLFSFSQYHNSYCRGVIRTDDPNSNWYLPLEPRSLFVLPTI